MSAIAADGQIVWVTRGWERSGKSSEGRKDRKKNKPERSLLRKSARNSLSVLAQPGLVVQLGFWLRHRLHFRWPALQPGGASPPTSRALSGGNKATSSLSCTQPLALTEVATAEVTCTAKRFLGGMKPLGNPGPVPRRIASYRCPSKYL